MEMFASLTPRQKNILGLVVRTFIETGMPVGSKTLVDNYDLDVSSATVRNELSALDEMGYLVQLHTSAGRIPTEQGYRYFVQRLLGEFELPLEDQQTIRHQFHQARIELEQWLRLSAAILARLSGGAGVVTSPRPQFNRFKHLQLISTRGRLVLMILVFSGGKVQQEMLTLAEPLPQTRLSMAAEHINQIFGGQDADAIAARMRQLDTLETEVMGLVVRILRQHDARAIHSLYRDGLSNLLDDKGTRLAVRLLEERTLFGDVVQTVLEPDVSGVQVVIGGEGHWEELKDCTIILSRYGVDELSGELGVVGPTRMSYGRNISAVRYVADIMSGFVDEYYAEHKPASLEDK
ncbi:MAG TPA: heat-inducible transcriptional repressor HrcA [Anaerolineae bacterium]|nr:heat-inducible transcriptional repressor HrcA [Anaerolineae bacterium]